MPTALLLAAVLVASPVGASAVAAPPDPSLDDLLDLPLGRAALALEQAVGAEVGPAQAALDRVVATARSWLPEATPEATFAALAQAAALACPRVVAGTPGTLFSESLASGACDCDVLSVLYLTVADELGLPIEAVVLPNHMMVAWDEPGRRVYWETTEPGLRPAWFVEALVPSGAGRAYAQAQSRRDMIGFFYQVRAVRRLEDGDDAGALADFDRAVGLDADAVVTRYNRGRAHVLAGRYAQALDDLGRATTLDPSHADAWYFRALASLALDQPGDALSALARATELEGPTADVLHVEGVAQAQLGDVEAALESYAASLALDPNQPLVYHARAELYERLGRAEDARRDRDAAARLGAETVASQGGP